ncbi:MAG: hypothetical protein ACOX23_06085 [Peptococcia bacterium]|jgi:hypothetical protein
MVNALSCLRFSHGKVLKILTVVFLVAVLMVTFASPVLGQQQQGGSVNAYDVGFNNLNMVLNFIVSWVYRLGFVIAFFGALQLILGFMNDDADAKVSGLKVLAAGFMLAGLCLMAQQLFNVGTGLNVQ